MRLDDLEPSKNVRDLGQGSRRSGFGGMGAGRSGGGMGLLMTILPFLLRSKLGWAILIIGGIGYFMFGGGNVASMLSGGLAVNEQSQQSPQSSAQKACDSEKELFACQVLASTEQSWGQLFAAGGQQYKAPTLNFYTNNNSSACGEAQSAMGPFYCPADQGIYLDTGFFDEMKNKLGASGDFAYAYVIAHEVGHHIQTITGISNKVRTAQSRASQQESNALQVRMELQADCYAGVWANLNQDRLEAGDIEEGMIAANAIGDDTLSRAAGRRPVPESFTHGTSAQRKEWLNRGLQSGNPNDCDTFKGLL